MENYNRFDIKISDCLIQYFPVLQDFHTLFNIFSLPAMSASIDESLLILQFGIEDSLVLIQAVEWLYQLFKEEVSSCI